MFGYPAAELCCRVMIRDTKNAVEVCTGALFDFQDLHVQGADGSCVHVHSSARADLKSCIAGDAATGYALRSGAALSLFRCDINSTCIAGTYTLLSSSSHQRSM